jgi:protease secretion system membrane fusion protein
MSPEEREEKKSTALVTKFKELDKKAESWISSWNPYHPDQVRNRPLKPVVVEESIIRKKMAQIFMISFGLFMVWALFAPIDTGITAQGVVIVSGYRKALQHPTGGVVQEILVKEGQEVQEGDILIRVNPLKAEADLTAAQLQYYNVLATEARLLAERNGSKKITWPAELKEMASDPRVVDAKQAQEKLFVTRYQEYGMALASRRAQVESLREEAKSNAELAKEGYVSRMQANQVDRTKIEAEMALSTLQATYQKDIDGQLSEVYKNRDALKSRLDAVSYERDLTAIRAPVTGTVVGFKVYTVGGTISPGQLLAEIVPKDAVLMVDAQIPPFLIDKVKLGSQADMRFVSFNVNITPTVPGIVKLIGVDRRPNDTPATDDDNYLAQIEATPEGMAKLGTLQVQPGMPVDVVFKTGERTFFSYLLKPLVDKLAKGFQDM